MSGEVKVLSRTQPEMPSYFRKDRVGRDEFLSQMGHFGEDQRSLFNRLCDMWEPDMVYSKFFSKAGHEFLNAEATLQALMNNLEKGNCGVVSLNVKGEELYNDRIILTDRDSPRFWYWLVENRWQACRVSDRKTFPTVSSVKKQGGFPPDSLQPLALAEISGTFIENHGDELVMYALPDLDGRIIIVTPATIYLMVEVARLKIRANLADSPLKAILARLMGTVVSSMGKSLTKNDNLFWNKLTESILSNREDLLVKKSNLDPEVFVAAKILKIFTRNEIDEAEKRREEESEKKDTIQAILGQLAQKEEFLMEREEFEKQFLPYREKWPDLREMFLSVYTKPPGKIGLPSVVIVGDCYLFRDHLYPLFKSSHKEAMQELKGFYLDMIYRILRTNNRDRFTAFTGIESFREDIRERLSAEFPILAEMLSKPRLVSEGIIHYSTKVLKISDMERVKGTLNRYFEGGSIRFKNPELLFELPPNTMFAEAFRRLNWFRRLILRLFGRYESYVQTLNSSPGTDPLMSKSQSMKYVERPPETARPYRLSAVGIESPAEPVARMRKPTSFRKKSYSAKQQEDAWDQFRNAYEKKKGKQ